MSGVYFHIPFCKRVCAYCDFFKSADLKLMPSVIEAMHRELEDKRDFLNDHKIRTIYFGGGTPSLCNPQELQRLIDHTGELFDCSSISEITVEANPDDLTDEYVAALRRTQINRLSIGIQSFDDAELKFMNRRHTAQQAINAVCAAQRAGFSNITIDLIFGVAGFGGEVLQHNLATALSLGVQHISAYHLTVATNTTLGRRVACGKYSEVSDEQSEHEYITVHQTLTQAGFEHYEVSNFALNGFRAQHNSAYWSGAEYLGIGAGAHSFNGTSRHWTECSVAEYATKPVYEEEELTQTDCYNEYIMTSLRTMEGVDTKVLSSQYGEKRLENFIAASTPILATGVLSQQGDRVFIPPQKMLLSDFVISALFET